MLLQKLLFSNSKVLKLIEEYSCNSTNVNETGG